AEDGAAVGLAGDRHETAEGLGERVETGLLPPGAVWPEGGDRAVDEARVHALDRVVVDAEPLGHPAPEALDDHVGPRGEPAERVPALRLLDVETDAALVAVDREVEHALSVADRARVH